MADLKISAATLNPAPAGTDNFATDKAGVDFRTTLDQIKAFASAGLGDVSKVGTPVNDQIGVWTGDGTIEGTAGLRFDGSQLLLPNYSFPAADGAADQVLSTDGAGVVSFKDQIDVGGLLSATYRFSTSIVAADPGPGLFRYNSATPASVTQIFIDAITDGSVDVSNILSLITTNDRLYIQSQLSPDEFIVFNVTAPITDNTGWFTITGTIEASGVLHASNVRCLFILDIGGAANGGGDVFKVGTPANNQLGVWTGDGTIEGDLNFQVVGTSFEGVNVNGPALRNVAVAFSVPTVLVDKADINTGLGGSPGDTNLLSLIANGNECGRASHISGVPQFSVGDGTLIRPGFSFISDTLTGLGRLASSEVSVIAASVEIARFGALGMDTRGKNIFNGDTTLLDLSVTAGSDGVGIGGLLTLRAGASGASGARGGSVLIEGTNGAGGGAEGGDVTINTGNANGSGDDGGDFLVQAGFGVGGGGNGGNASIIAGLTNGAGAGGIASLIGGRGPNGSGLGGIAAVTGGASGVLGGTGGDAVISGGLGTGGGVNGDVVLSVGGVNIVYDQATDRLIQGAEIFAYQSEIVGNVTKVGTPVNNQIGVWTGDGTLEGDANLTWTGAHLNIGPSTGSPGTLQLSFGDGDTGFYQLADDILNMAFAAVGAYSFRASSIITFNGPTIQNELPSATNPVFCPHFAETDTGMGWSADVVYLIGGGVSQARTAPPASGGLEANNTATGAGFERVLTISDLAQNDAVQARRTTVYALTTAFVDITMDVTDIETDAAVINHDLITNTDNIIFGAAGTYEVTYDMEVICTAVTGDPIIDMGCRVRINDLGTGLAGSLANPYAFRDGSVGGADGNFQVHVSNTFLVTVAATDFITLQLDKTELSGTATFNVSKICMKVRRLT